MAQTGLTDRARERFLEHLAESGNVSASCRFAGISRQTAYVRKKENPDFAAAWEEAEETAIDKLEEVARERAVVDKSDRMLEILLKAHRPEKYVEKRLLGSDPDNPLPTGFSVNLVKASKGE